VYSTQVGSIYARHVHVKANKIEYIAIFQMSTYHKTSIHFSLYREEIAFESVPRTILSTKQ